MMQIQFNGKRAEKSVLIKAVGLDAQGDVSEDDYYQDGGRVHVRMGVRTVRLTYAVMDNFGEARREIYGIFQLKKQGTLTVITDDNEYSLTGIVSGAEGGRWQRKETIEVTITCSDPWLYMQQKQLVLATAGSLKTATEVNTGDETGFIATGLGRTGAVNNTTTGVQIAWDIPDTSVTSLTLITAEGSRNLYDPVSGISYAEYITAWGWPALAHGSNQIIIGGGVQAVTYIPRRAGI